jgi:Protein of unknown function (DUF3352)
LQAVPLAARLQVAVRRGERVGSAAVDPMTKERWPVPSPSSSRSRRLPLALLALVAAVVALVAAGCGGGGGDENADPASVAPKGAPIYFTGFVRPQGSQKTAVEAIARKVAGVSNPGAAIEQSFDRSSSAQRQHLTFKDDVKPWLGRRAAVVVSAFGGSHSAGAAIVASKDDGKARDFVDKTAKGSQGSSEKRSYKGVDYRFNSSSSTAYAVVGNFVVIGNEPELKRIVDASKGSSLKDDKQYATLAGQAQKKLGFGFVDVRSLVDDLGASGQLPAGQGAALGALLGSVNKPVTFTLDAKPSQVTVDVAGPAASSVASTRQASVVGTLPGNAWAAVGLGDVGGALRRTIARFASGGIGAGVVQSLAGQLRTATGLDLNRDILAGIGDVGFFASGSNLLQVGGGAVITSPDPGAARRLVAKLGALITRLGARSRVRVTATRIGGASGVRIRTPRLPGSINLVVKGSRLVAAYGDAATRSALSSGRTLGNNPAFQQASASLGAGATPAVYVDFGPLATLVGSSSSPNAQRAARVLHALNNLVVGGSQQGGNAVARLIVNLR